MKVQVQRSCQAGETELKESRLCGVSSLIICKKPGIRIRQQRTQYDYCSYTYMVTHMINNEDVNHFGLNVSYYSPNS